MRNFLSSFSGECVTFSNIRHPFEGLGCRLCGGLHRLFTDRPMQQRCDYPKCHTGPPDRQIGPGRVLKVTTHPNAHETADLMAEKHNAKQRPHVAWAEHVRHQPGREGNR